MDNIFNQIKKRLFNLNETPVTDEHWNSFVSYRSEKLRENKKFLFGWPIFTLLGFLLLSLGANGFLLNNRNQNEQQLTLNETHHTDTIYIMQTAMASGQSTSLDSKLDSSLTVLRAMIKQQEHSILAHRKAERILSINNVSKELNSLNSLSDLFARYPAAYNIIHDDIQRGSQSVFWESLPFTSINHGHQAKKQMSLGAENSSYDKSTLVHPIDYLTTQPFQLKNNLSNHSRSRRNILLPTKKKSFLETILPKTFSIGLFGGLNSPVNYRYSDQLGSFYGANVSTMFSSRVRGNLNLGSHRLIGKSSEMGPGTGVPEIVLLENQILEYVKIQQTSYMASVGFDYIFSQGKNLRPFAGLGYGMAFNNRKKYNYELLSLQGEIYERRQLKSNMTNQFGSITAGLDFRISPHVNAHLAIDYLFFSGTPTDVPNRYHIRPSLLYHF